MCRFIETICVEAGSALRLDYHNRRLNATRHEVWGDVPELRIEQYIKTDGYVERTRLRIEYDTEIRKVEYIPYHLRPVSSLRLVEMPDDADYHLKYADRSVLNALFERRDGADDVLAVRDGFITDTSIANVALWDGEQWHTPSHPLLKGTHRQFLIDNGMVAEREIKTDELSRYTKIRLFNAMIHFGEIEFSTDRLFISNPLL